LEAVPIVEEGLDCAEWNRLLLEMVTGFGFG
jgi:hypothetical protein